jgi:pimeloyl-ACP methyl ester carboxylesterase
VRPKRAWLVVLGVVVVAILAPIGFAGWVGQNPPSWLPTPMVTFAFDVRLTTAPLAKKVISLARGSPLDKRIYVADPGEMVRFPSGTVQLVGSLHGPGDGAALLPGVLLLHGSTPEGRRMGLYRIMAEALAERGYSVLAIDQRGFGQSAPAPDPAREDAYDYVGDALRALAYLASRPAVDPARLNVVGHSFGVGVALTAGLEEPRTQGIVIISPGAPELPARRVATVPVEDAPGPPAEPAAAGQTRASGRNYMARRAFRYGSRVWVPGVDYVGQPIPLEAHAQAGLAGPDHPALLIITDAFEEEETRAALETWERHVAGPSRLFVAPRADHYLNTAGWGRVVLYDVRAVAGVVDQIDAWLGGSAAGCAVHGGCSWPGLPLALLLVVALLAIALLIVTWHVTRRRASSTVPR